MSRSVLPEDRVHPAVRDALANSNKDILDEVQKAVDSNDVVVVGMGQNPFPRKAKKALTDAGVPFTYLEYGNYLGQWRRRNAIKMWTGWPTFPQIFVKRTFIGGFTDLSKLIASGELKTLLEKK